MKIGIIGAGNVGASLGRIWAQSGHQVLFSYSRDPQKLQATALGAGANARVGTPREAAAWGEVVLLSVPWARWQDALAQAGATDGTLDGKLLWSSVNALKPDMSGLEIGTTTSAAEVIAASVPGARFVEALPINADVLAAEAPFGAQLPSAFACGDDADAKAVVLSLMRRAGMDAQDAGPLQMARLLEPAGLLVGLLGYTRQRHFALQVLQG